MGLKTTQQTALDNLAALITFASTGIRRVYIDPPDQVNELPALLVVDQGFKPSRSGQWQEIQWPLRFQVLVQRAKLAEAIKKCRDIRGDLIDQLDTNITLSGAVSRTTWSEEGLQLASLEYGGAEFAGIDGTYLLWLKEHKAFA